jgi:hypothetical protein
LAATEDYVLDFGGIQIGSFAQNVFDAMGGEVFGAS